MKNELLANRETFKAIQLRSYREIRKSIYRHRNVELKKISMDELYDLTGKLLSGVVLPRISINQNGEGPSPTGFGIFRVRSTEENKLFVSESDFWEKPANLNTEPGRCHGLCQSVLYCSNHFATALIECNALAGTYWTITEYKVKEGMDIPFIALGIKNRGIINQVPFPIADFYSGIHQKEIQKNNLIDKYLHNVFIEKVVGNKDHYKKTISIARFYFEQSYKGIPISIIYPSVASNEQGINLALKPDCAREHLEIVRSFYVRINGYNDDRSKIELTFIADGRFENGQMQWCQNVSSPFKV